MRQKWYIGLAFICTFLILRRVLFFDDSIWFLLVFCIVAVIFVYDVFQKKHSILRNFPILGHFRFLFEFIRPELRQYLLSNDGEELPFNRETRSLIYQRAKNERDTIAFGGEKNLLAIGYTWMLHSITPKSPLEVEPRISIGGPDCLKPYLASRLNISAMSFGSLSPHALMALNQGAKIGGFAQNTGEGGISPYHLQGGDIVFQLGTGYFGCRDEHGHFDAQEFTTESNRDEVKMIEVKLSQGAKPAHGGILPAAKLTPEIAKVRKVPMGHDVLSPIAHTAFDTPLGLLQFIKKLRTLSGGKPIGFKLCVGRKDQFLGICKAMLETNILPDFITIDGAEGGTGAAPIEYVNYIGEPLESGLTFVHDALVGVGLRDKIRLICSGKITNGYDLVLRIAMGADICNSARAFMMATGCVQSKQCNANTCPTGVATQDKRLQRGLVVDEKKHRVADYHQNTIKSFKELVGAIGLTNPSDLKPHHIMRRLSQTSAKPLDEIYQYLEPGQLLSANIPENYQTDWELASAERF
jgi:glutamate synthase domain-containing protein 2